MADAKLSAKAKQQKRADDGRFSSGGTARSRLNTSKAKRKRGLYGQKVSSGLGYENRKSPKNKPRVQ